MSGYPKAMTHPNAVKGSTKAIEGFDPNSGKKFTDYQGNADKFPPVTVHNADQEARHRAGGYVTADDNAVMLAYRDYPVWMKNAEGAEVLANNAADEERHAADGFERKGKGNPDAVQKAYASPYDPDALDQEWPKMIDGVLTEDPSKDQSGYQFYPMWCGDKLVNTEAEEREARGGMILRDGKLIGETTAEPEKVADPHRDALVAVAKMRGINVTDEMGADDIEAALFRPTTLAEEKDKIAEGEKASLLAEASERGIKVDKRWNVAKLRDALKSEAA